MRKKPLFWVGPVVLLGFVSIGVGATDAAREDARRRRSRRRRPRRAPRRRAQPARRCAEAHALFRGTLADTQGHARPRPRQRRGARDGRGPAALQGGRERRHGAGRSSGGRDHLRPRHERSAVGGEFPEPALDRQHHQGDDGDGLLREQPRHQPDGDHREERRLSGVDDAICV